MFIHIYLFLISITTFIDLINFYYYFKILLITLIILLFITYLLIIN